MSRLKNGGHFISISNWRYSDVIMGVMASQITSLAIVYSTVYWGANQRKHQSSAPLAFVRGIHRSPVNSPHKGPVTRKRFPFDDVIIVMAHVPWSTTSPTSFRSSWAKNPIMEKMTKPANILVDTLLMDTIRESLKRKMQPISFRFVHFAKFNTPRTEIHLMH